MPKSPLMKIRHTTTASKAFDEAPEAVRKAFLKQIGFLKENLKHPSLHAKKYDESQDLWQARVNKDWRFDPIHLRRARRISRTRRTKHTPQMGPFLFLASSPKRGVHSRYLAKFSDTATYTASGT